MTDNKVAIRDAFESDFEFIYSTWLKGLKFGNEHFKKTHQKSYFEHEHKKIERLLKRSGVYILVACLVSDPTTILGYAIREDEHILHYVHVKYAFRKFGIAKSLCPKDIKLITHYTNVGYLIFKEKFPNGIYDPYFIEGET